MTERKVLPRQINHAAVLNVIPKGPKNQKRKKAMEIKKSVIKRSKLKAAVKIQKKLKSPQINYKVNQKKQIFIS